MTARLIGRTGRVEELDVLLRGLVRLGAAPENEIRIVGEGVSRTHARVGQEGAEYWIEDAQSTNGTFVNGQRVGRQRLQHLDVVTLGREVDLIFIERAGEPVAPVDQSVRGAAIEWLDGPDEGTRVELARGEILIGRVSACALVADTRAVSRTHAKLLYSADGITIQDLGSSNGTFVNNARVSGTAPLENRDLVSLGGGRSFRVVIERDARVQTNDAYANTEVGPVFDEEWRTRLMWSAEELPEIEVVKPSPVGPAAPASPAPPVGPTSGLGDFKPLPVGSTVGSGTSETRLGGGRLPAGVPSAVIAGAAESSDKADASVTRLEKVAEASAGGVLPGEVARAAQEQANIPGRAIKGIRLIGAGGTFDVGLGTSVVGRGQMATVNIPHREISRTHSAFTITPMAVMVEDRGSANGTLVNGVVTKGSHPVADGDRVVLGVVEFRVEFLYEEASTQ